jgi:glycerol-3-phosphate acyltransferase PlsY
MILAVPLFFIAYLMGSLPWAVWVGNRLYGTDVRTQGSRSAGATNTFRVLGTKAGVVVLALDVLKGVAAAALAYMLRDMFVTRERFMLLQFTLGVAAAIGHIFPVFAGFRGGKGVATLTGALFFVFPQAALVAALVFVSVFLVSNYISLASLSAAYVVPWAVCIIYRIDFPLLEWLLWLAPLLLIYTHRANLSRLWHGNENKIYLLRHRRMKMKNFEGS